MYKYLFFDADNTLFDFNLAEKMALESLFDYYSIPKTERYFSSYTDINEGCWRELEKGLLDGEELKTERFSRFFSKHGFSYDAKEAGIKLLEILSGKGPLVDNAYNLLSSLKKSGYRLYMITNGYITVQNGRIDKSGIRHFFDRIFISEEIGYNKPDIRFFSYIEKHISFDKKEALIIGDSQTSDIKLGNLVNIDTVLFDPTGNLSTTANYKIRSLPELYELLNRD